MGSVVLSKKIIDKYFGYLKNLDIKSKRNLITKLTESIENEPEKEFDINSIYGAWEDTRSSDELIAEIRSSRIEKVNTEDLE